MTHDEQNLERELAALRPRAASRELEQRIAHELAVRPAAVGRGGRVWLAIGGAAAVAAMALMAVVLWRSDRAAQQERRIEPAAQIAAAFDDRQPSLGTYQRALRRSLAEAEALLDQHASVSSADHSAREEDLFVRVHGNPLLKGEL
jgi:hypothetical protein